MKDRNFNYNDYYNLSTEINKVVKKITDRYKNNGGLFSVTFRQKFY